MTSSMNKPVEEILAAYGDHILRLAFSYLHHMEDAEDILQDTLIQYMKAAPVFRDRDHEKAWLLRVTANLSKNRLKYNRIRTGTELEERPAPEREDLTFVWEAVKALPVKYAEVIHLYYQEGYSTAQIAAILDMAESTVRVRLNRGRKRLKNVLREAYDFEG